MKIYEHKQIGFMMPIVAAVVTILSVVLMFSSGEVRPAIAVIVLVDLILLAFSILTVAVEDNILKFWFGLGIFRKRIPLQDVATVQAVTNPWYYGWGIHLTLRGWVYNVSGFKAVEVALKSGKTFRLGTPEPENLQRIITEQLALLQSKQ